MAILASRGLLKHHLDGILLVDLSPSIALVVLCDILERDGGMINICVLEKRCARAEMSGYWAGQTREGSQEYLQVLILLKCMFVIG